MLLRDYLQIKLKTHLIFDFDKTLFKLILDWDRYFNFIENELIRIDKSIFWKYRGDEISWSEMQNLYISQYGTEVQKLIYQNNIKAETKLLTGIKVNKELIDFIKEPSSYKMFIWSSNVKPVISKILRNYGLLGKFNKIVGRLDLVLLKPEPEGFEKICEPNISRDKYLMIGNSLADKEAAKRIGIDLFLVDYFN